MVKTNTKVFCKDNIKNITKDCPGGSYLVLWSKHMVLRGRPLISIGYNYNAEKFLSFIVTYNTRSTQTGVLYFSKYPDQFTNVAVHPVDRPLVISKNHHTNPLGTNLHCNFFRLL